ncbi:MAG: fumarylacetoacetate hydrolase family protein [Legionellaceae bacterium]|nr:fumarylacetoacetate hydrolase family protein [Legionellaceae bacterium]
MKLASLKSPALRDGELCVVSKDLQRAVKVTDIAPSLQIAVERWTELEKPLRERYLALNEATVTGSFPFDPKAFCSPLPRAYQWADGSAYVNHVELVRKARGAEMPEQFWTDPLMYQGGSDAFIGPCDDILVASEDYGIDFEAEVAVITDDVAMGTTAAEALPHVKLIMLVNDVSLRHLIPGELGKGFGFFHAKPASSFSPVAVTPDELADSWRDGKIHLPLYSELNGNAFGHPNAGVDMTFSFADLIAHAAKTRQLSAGTIIGSGTVSNCDRSKGSSCLAEKRMLETIEFGQAKTPFMRFGDRIKIEMHDTQGASIFGAIDQKVTAFVKE